MNPDKQNQPEQPDYSFITNQNQQVAPPKNNNSKLYVIIGLTLLLMITFVVSAVLTKPKEMETNAGKNDVTDTFMGYLDDAGDESLYKANELISLKSHGIDNAVPLIMRIRSSIKENSCVGKQYTESTVEYECQKNQGEKLNIILSLSSDKSTIIGIKVS